MTVSTTTFVKGWYIRRDLPLYKIQKAHWYDHGDRARCTNPLPYYARYVTDAHPHIILCPDCLQDNPRCR